MHCWLPKWSNASRHSACLYHLILNWHTIGWCYVNIFGSAWTGLPFILVGVVHTIWSSSASRYHCFKQQTTGSVLTVLIHSLRDLLESLWLVPYASSGPSQFREFVRNARSSLKEKLFMSSIILMRSQMRSVGSVLFWRMLSKWPGCE